MLGIVVPCYNEGETLDVLIERFAALSLNGGFEAVFVDDGSTDSSSEKLRAVSEKLSWIRVVTHEKNLGFGRSLKDGLGYALGKGYEHIAHMDCDLTHPPELIPEMLKISEDADLVIASRYVPGGGMKNVSYWRTVLSVVGNMAFRAILRIKTKDATSGFRLGRREVFEKLNLGSESFGIQLESTVRAERLGFIVKEVPLILENRALGRSKFRLRYLAGYVPLVFKLALRRKHN